MSSSSSSLLIMIVQDVVRSIETLLFECLLIGYHIKLCTSSECSEHNKMMMMLMESCDHVLGKA